MSPPLPITEDDLEGFVDDVLDAESRAAVQTYLDGHPEEARRIAAYVAQRALLRDALRPIAEEPVPPQLGLSHLIEAQRRPRLRIWSTAAAAVVALSLSGVGGWSLRGMTMAPMNGIAALAQEATMNYMVYAPDRLRPVELKAADRDELVSWASDQLHHPISVPDLTVSGYRFMGGRVVATMHGPAAMLLYDDDHGSRVAMLIRPMAIDRDTKMTRHEDRGVTGFTWAGNGIGYSVVASQPAGVLHPLADEMRRQINSREAT
jgi:anti-sigma factor RsiW